MNRPPSIMAPALLAMGLTIGLIACVDNQTPPAELPPYEPGDAPVLDCVPDLDGRIDHTELTPNLGVPVSYRVSPAGVDRPVNLRGQVDQFGTRVWDWSATDGLDQRLEIAAEPLSDQWYASSFPDGEFTTLLNPDLNWEAVYSHDTSGLHFHGYASADETPPSGTTLVVYDDPVTLYAFPMQEGDSWASTGVIRNATLRGLPYAGEDHYVSTVDASGELWLPELTFSQVLRVNTEVTLDPALSDPITHRQVSFFFECFGEVARAVSAPSEEDPEFSTATEVRRLGF